ncbi:MAG TPA: hypothetical protein VIW94_07415, partial [Acidimicrobiia bacterium]
GDSPKKSPLLIDRCPAPDTHRSLLSRSAGQESERIRFRIEGVDKSRDLRLGDRLVIDNFKSNSGGQ